MFELTEAFPSRLSLQELWERLAAPDGSGSLDDLAASLLVLERRGMIRRTMEGGREYLQATRPSFRAVAGDPMDGAALARKAIDTMIHEILPEADRRGDAAVVLSRGLFRAGEGRGVAQQLRDAVEAAWKARVDADVEGPTDEVALVFGVVSTFHGEPHETEDES